MFQANSSFFGQQDALASSQGIFNGDIPSHYTDSFELLKKYIDQSLDQYKEDLQNIIFPVFTLLFLNMMRKKYY